MTTDHYYQDKLVIRWYKAGRIISQGKRVAKGCLISPEARRLYVHKGYVECVKQIRRENPQMPFRDVIDMLDAATR